jgi:hypothetical protein
MLVRLLLKESNFDKNAAKKITIIRKKNYNNCIKSSLF